MTVSVEFAKTHFAELINAIDKGEPVAIARPDLPTLRLVADDATSSETRKRSLLGIGKGQLWIADDFDAPEVNQEIADLFEQ